ncbi:MAG: hydroxymethylbilane synthase [Candidatus Micrarchaeota archaeon]|nr:hydroxymethylbilane synthase [Candidatus Micrarchaeota archaeon]MDE1864403.1 hydroxymethylbilane synthase [Candidatus Micrarchaeota archaeon]
MARSFIIGTRGSKLSTIQTQQAADAITAVHPSFDYEIVYIKTEGDRKPEVPLSDISTDGIFTKDIEDELLTKKIDIAVHSLKDLPTIIHSDLAVSAVTRREDARDVLISNGDLRLDQLPRGARIGTESPRRMSQLRAYRDDFNIMGLRGNVDTRIRKLDNGEYDAIVIAAAGVIRLGAADRIAEYLPISMMVPAPGQGALAIQTRRGDVELNAMLKKVEHIQTRVATDEERAFLGSLGGGCVVPIGAYAEVKDGSVLLHGFVGNDSGKKIFRGKMAGAIGGARSIGNKLAQRLLAQGAYKILGGEIDYEPLRNKNILITSERRLAEALSLGFRELGSKPILFPTIKTMPLDDNYYLDSAIRCVSDYDWVVFTSGNGARFVLERMRELGCMICSPKVAAVGPATARALAEGRVKVDYVPRRYLTMEVVNGMGDVSGKRILLLRSNIADMSLPVALKKRGAIVSQVDAYKTIQVSGGYDKLQKIMCDSGISYIVFSSTSAVASFAKLFGAGSLAGIGSKIICIGPVTAIAVRDLGASSIVAQEHTAEGIIRAVLKDYIGD